MNTAFLPVSMEDVRARGWTELDIILVTGDAYVDHPSYGAAIIGRTLESEGFRVGIIAQPAWRSHGAFSILGRPKLYFGVTAGNLDSMVANYTANKRLRSQDDYSPGRKSGLRPDRAAIVYTNKIKEAFPGVPVVIGGIEASLRRLAHYDHWSEKVRRSILLDSKADILVYGMGEKQSCEIARRLRDGESVKSLDNIPGTAFARNSLEGLKNYIEIPSFEEVSVNKEKFSLSFKTIYLEADPVKGKTVIQKHAERYVVALPPAMPMTTEELDKLYLLDYAASWHPEYEKEGGVPGFETVRYSVVSHRGCCGGCSFCSLYLHQGRIVQSRSEDSIVEEVKRMARRQDFRGTVTDIGGPTANLYMADCGSWKKGACRNKLCLAPEKCKELKLGYKHTLALWERLKKIPQVKHVFVGSGVRYDLLCGEDADAYLNALCSEHVSGRLKVAPEHCVDSVLKLMNKPSIDVYDRFTAKFEDVNRRLGKEQYLVNYFITGHPGSRLEDALRLGLYLSKKRINPEQVQDYIPLPMTLAGCMYYTGSDPMSGKEVYVARNPRERKMHRALMQPRQSQNKKYVLEALRKLNKMFLAKNLLR